ncbi:MAG: HEAT repeat domain-containing protein [Gammaproteobacteria bacterium]|nr:HEAT repeat domain-containing protein [Gammaproteobacteria bacterium]
MSPTAPPALLFTAPGCPHCPGVKAALLKLHEEGVIGTLEVISVTDQPQQAAALGIRTVPWLRLGEFILTGAQRPQQLRRWAERAGDPAAMSDYLSELLATGGLAEAERLLRAQPQQLPALLALLQNEESPIQVRLGVSAILEGFEGDEPLRALLPQLIALSAHPDHRLRSDGCHLLGLSHDEGARAALLRCQHDPHPEVREIATEALLSLPPGSTTD